MSIDRSIWQRDFSRFSKIPWRCPACAASMLRIKKDTLSDGETAGSKAQRSELAFEPEWIEGRFSCLLECPSCSGEIGVAGTWEVRDERGYRDGEEDGDYTNYYTPAYFTDSPHIIELPKKTPEEVRDEIVSSFQLFWQDPLACANRIRAAIEALLTAQRVNRSAGRPQAGKRRKMLQLHRRIELFAGKRPVLSNQLMAIKVIGNAGSHTDVVTKDDLLDAYEILGFVLDELYVGRSRRVGALAERIIRRAAPLSPRRPKR